jgi:hypothetical protein
MSDSGGINQQIGDLVFAVETDGATPPVILSGIGVNQQTATPAGVVRNGKGDYTVNFPLNACDPTSRAHALASRVVGQIVSLNPAIATDTSQGVLVTDAAAAAIDGGFSLSAVRTKD